MTTLKSTQEKVVSPGERRSTRFSPSLLTEKLVPALLILLLVVLAAVLVIIGLSLFGVVPTA